MAFKVGDKVKQTSASPYRGRIGDDEVLEVAYVYKSAESRWVCPINCVYKGDTYPFKENELVLANSPTEGTSEGMTE